MNMNPALKCKEFLETENIIGKLVFSIPLVFISLFCLLPYQVSFSTFLFYFTMYTVYELEYIVSITIFVFYIVSNLLLLCNVSLLTLFTMFVIGLSGIFISNIKYLIKYQLSLEQKLYLMMWSPYWGLHNFYKEIGYIYQNTLIINKNNNSKFNLILLHGFLQNTKVWNPIISEVPDAFDVIAPTISISSTNIYKQSEHVVKQLKSFDMHDTKPTVIACIGYGSVIAEYMVKNNLLKNVIKIHIINGVGQCNKKLNIKLYTFIANICYKLTNTEHWKIACLYPTFGLLTLQNEWKKDIMINRMTSEKEFVFLNNNILNHHIIENTTHWNILESDYTKAMIYEYKYLIDEKQIKETIESKQDNEILEKSINEVMNEEILSSFCEDKKGEVVKEETLDDFFMDEKDEIIKNVIDDVIDKIK